MATKGHGWTRDGVDYLDGSIKSDQNRELATFVAEVGALGPDEAADHMTAVIRSPASEI